MKISRRARIVAAALAGTGFLAAFSPQALAGANDLQTRHNFTIPAQPLDKALLAFSDQAKVQVLMWAELKSDAKSSGATGELRALDALNAILANTGLAYKQIDKATVAIVKPDGTDKSAGVGAPLHLAQSNPPAALDLGQQSPSSSENTQNSKNQTTASLPSTEGKDHESKLEEIVVTAQRRDQNLDKVPISVSVLGATQLDALGITSLSSLGAGVPGLSMDRGTTGILVALRGIGTTTALAGDEPVTAVYVDGVYLPAAQANQFDLPNVERIEVIKGPQGTLFGRNAVAGVIQIITRKPTVEPTYEASVGYGNYKTVYGNFYGSTGLASNVAIDMTVHYQQNFDGYGNNITTGHEMFRGSNAAFASKLAWDVSDTTEFQASASYSRDKTQLGALRLIPGATGIGGIHGPANFWDISSNIDSYEISQNVVTSAKLTHDMGWASVSDQLAYQSNKTVTQYDLDGIALPLLTQNDIRLFTRVVTDELQIISPKSSKISWIGGFFFMNDDAGYGGPSRVTGRVLPPFLQPGYDLVNEQITHSYSGFAQGTAPIVEGLNLTLGGRWTWDDRRVRGAQYLLRTGQPAGGAVLTNSASYADPSARVALDYNVTPDTLLYVSYNRGFKSGNFNVSSPGSMPIKPMYIDAYEVGSKMNFFDHRMRFEISAFNYILYDMQLRAACTTSACGAPGTAATFNAAKGRSRGIDTSLSFAATSRLRLGLSSEILSTKFLEFPAATLSVPLAAGGNGQIVGSAAGNRLPRAPNFAGLATLNYTMPSSVGPFDLNLGYSYTSNYVWDSDGRLKNPAHGLLQSSIRWAPGDANWDIKIWADNMTNEKYYTFESATTGPSGGDLGSPAPPRTFGITFSVHH